MRLEEQGKVGTGHGQPVQQFHTLHEKRTMSLNVEQQGMEVLRSLEGRTLKER
jgi:hypothetical protein